MNIFLSAHHESKGLLIPCLLILSIATGLVSAQAQNCVDVAVEYKTLTGSRTKVGHVEFSQSEPPKWKYYKTYVNLIDENNKYDWVNGDDFSHWTNTKYWKETETWNVNAPPSNDLDNDNCHIIYNAASVVYQGTYYYNMDRKQHGDESTVTCTTSVNTGTGDWNDTSCTGHDNEDPATRIVWSNVSVVDEATEQSTNCQYNINSFNCIATFSQKLTDEYTTK